MTPMRMIAIVVLFFVINLAETIAQGTSSWLSAIEHVSSLYDQRGYMKDKTRTVDGNLSVSRSTGNVQYVFDISSYSVNGYPVNVSLSYNQNASFTAYRRYDLTSDSWISIKQNRPVWILGVNGFAVQALHRVTRNVLEPRLRQNVEHIGAADKPIDSQFGEDDMTWLLDGYDACNSMRSTERPLNDGEFLDEIKLLRADGSTLSLVRMEKRIETTPGSTPTAQNLVSGTYVTADANSTAFAIVTLNPARMSARYKEAVFRQLTIHPLYFYRGANHTDIPAEYIPRTVYYYPGDGSCFVFDEYKTPFGLEPMFGQSAVGGNTDRYGVDDFTYSGYGAAAPSVFYLRSITYNTLPITTFSYSAHNGMECPDGNLVRGRSSLTGFDNHTISYTARGLEINALGRLFVIECDAGLLSGKRDNNSKSSYYEGLATYGPDNTTQWDDPYQYQSWTPLVTRVLDPGPREYRLTYEPYTRVQKAAPFPFTTLQGETVCCGSSCLCPGHGSTNHSDLLTQVARLKKVEDPYASYLIGYENLPEWNDATNDAPFLDHLRQRYGAAIPGTENNCHLSYISEYSAMPAPSNSPIVDPTGSTVATVLTKHDRANTSAFGADVGGVLWVESYERDYTYTAGNAPDNVPREAETIVNRATHNPDGAIVNSQSIEKVARYKMPIDGDSYFNMADPAFDRHIYHTDVVHRETRVGNRSEVERTVYDHATRPWERNWHLPDYTVSETWLHANQGEHAVLPKSRTDFSYVFNAASNNYVAYGTREGDEVLRGGKFNSSYGALLGKKTSTVSHYISSGAYTPASRTIEDHDYLPLYDPITYPDLKILDKIKSLQNLRAMYPVEEWEFRWNNAKATDDWVVIRDESTIPWEEQSVRYHLPPYSRLLISTETQDGENGWRTEQRTSHTYNTSVPTVANGGIAAYGRRVSTTTSGRGDERSRIESMEYGLYSGVATQRALPATMSDHFGAQQKFSYAGGPLTSNSALSVALGVQSGIRQITNYDCGLTGALTPEKDRRVSVALDSRFALLYEQPIHTMSVVRRPSIASAAGGGSWDVMRLETSQALTHYGLTSATVDVNGFLSQFTYDNIGRLKTAWLPLDFPWDPEQLSIDRIDSKLTCDSWGYSIESVTTKQVLSCFTDCDAPVPMVYEAVNEPTEQLPHYSVGVFNLPPGQCPCSETDGIRVKNTDGETVQHTRPAEAEIVTSKYLVKHETFVEFIVPKSRIKEVVNAKITLSVAAMSGFVAVYPVTLTVYAGDNVIHDQDDTNPLLIGQVSDPNQYSPVYSPVATYDGRVSIDLMEIPGFSALATGVAGDEDVRLRLEIKPIDDTYGRVEFGDVSIELEGLITSPNVNGQNDWTMHIEHADAPAHRVLTKVKIDDRPSAYDVSSYPTLSSAPNQAVYTRHTKQVTWLTTDDLVQKTRRGFEPSAQGFLDPAIPLTAASEATVTYNGAGQVRASTNERNLTTTLQYDGWGMQTESQTGAFVRDWADIAASANPTIVGSARERQTHEVRPPAGFFFPTTYAQRFNGYCARTLQVVSSESESSSRLNATFTDGLGRTIVSVQGYDSSFFAQDLALNNPTRNRNACTWFTYDAFGRTLTVTNPIGQTIAHSYDDFGNVKATSHPDNGMTSYSYDVAGRLRFSQTQAQADVSKLTFRQYDDLGRTTIVGEASIEANNAENNLVLNQRLTDMLNPDVLHTAMLSAIPTVNSTLFMTPVATPPVLYQMGMQPQGLPANGNNLVQMAAICPPLANAMNSHTFNPALPGMANNVIQHATRFHPYPDVRASVDNFEQVHAFPSFVLQSTWYDDLPPSVGAVWGGLPSAAVWNALAPHDTVRNLRGRSAAVAYRTHGGQPFHYIVLSYDERGRVEAQLRLTENLGFDAVYYRYNALNKLTSVHVVDATGQHATFYGYDSEGRVSRMWAERRNGGGFGLGTSMTPQRPTLIELDRQSLPHAVYGYDAADAVTSVEYPRLGVTTTIDVNARGAQLRTRTQKFNQLAPVIFEQRLAYDDLDQITAAWSTANGMADVEDYHYDVLGRLISVQGTDAALMNPRSESYGYDLAGNRRNALNNINGIAQTYTHAPTTNRLTRFIQSEAGNPMYRDHTLAYQSDGALATRTRSDAQGAQMVQRNESFAYDAFGLIERYRVQRDVGGMQGVCAPDASSQPISEWRYRFGPLQEREQKRQYLSDVPAGGLAWTYTLLGADAKQLASYNGIQGAFCGQPPTTVWLWPVEYNSYGPAHTRVIMRPGGTPEYVLHDHLGSARITLDNAARVIESQSYTAYGDHRTHDGQASRTSYIGRETDKESDLGFNGVRMYDPTYGRFLSVDPLWRKYLPLQSYQYAGNNPVMMLDDGGKEIVPVNLSNEELSMLQTLIGLLRSSGDAFIRQILDFAEGCESQIHVYALADERFKVTTSTPSVFGYAGAIETYWDRNFEALGTTMHTTRMKGSGEADVVLASESVLRSELPGYAAFVVLDELHHVFSARVGSQKEHHIALYSYLIEKMQNGTLQIPGLTIADVQAKLHAEFPELDRHRRDPTIQREDSQAEQKK